MTLTVALFGCGGMGRRHITGFQKLRTIGRDDVALVAVCDIDRANAERARDRAVELLGDAPRETVGRHQDAHAIPLVGRDRL